MCRTLPILFVLLFSIYAVQAEDDCLSDFLCDNGRCISYHYICDGVDDCEDNSDEEACHERTTLEPEVCEDQFRCNDNLCIPNEWLCNGVVDCLDGSDEPLTCTTTDCDGFKCHDGHCIPKEWKCDGSKDCPDDSDEDDCPTAFPTNDCDINREFQCAKSDKCIPLHHVCNNHADCPDGSDEGGKCFHDECSASSCEYGCVNIPEGIRCVCGLGYHNTSNKCTDIDECEIFGMCDQICKNTNGSYECSCQENYAYDGKACRAQGDDMMLLFATPSEVKGRYLDNKLNSIANFTVATNMKHVASVGYDGKYVYWTTIAEGEEAIMRSTVYGSEQEILFTSGLGLPGELVIDHVTNNIYFTDFMYKHIAVCNELGFLCSILCNDTDKPRALALNQGKGLMIWTDWGKEPKIVSAGMDGSNPTVLVSEKLEWPNGIAFDVTTDRIYWADAKLHIIGTIKLDGTDRREFSIPFSTPFSLDLFENRMFWSDWDKRHIVACNKFTGSNCRVVVKKQSEEILGIHIYQSSTLTMVSNPCKLTKCSHLCVLSPSHNNIDYSCMCPEDMELSSNMHTCTPLVKKNVFFVGGENKIIKIEPKIFGRFNISKSSDNIVSKMGSMAYDSILGRVIVSDLERRTLVAYDHLSNRIETIASTKIGRIIGMDFDYRGNNLFWVDEEMSIVEVMNLKNYARATLIREFGSDIPLDIAINGEDGVMYLALFSMTGAHIAQISIDGSSESRFHLVRGLVVGPRISLTYDEKLQRLFWTDSSGYIASTDKSGVDFHYYKKLPKQSPISMAFVGPHVFWSSYGSSSIYFDSRFNQNTTKSFDLSSYEMGNEIRMVTHYPPMMNVLHECYWDNGNCSALCLPTGKTKKCICQNGLQISNDGNTCMKKSSCKDDEYQCLSGECLKFSLRCDTKPNCPQGEDEKDCAHISHCPSGTYKCNEKCVPNDKLCGSDSNCPPDQPHCDNQQFCKDSDFRCLSGKCIAIEFKCDDHYDCDDQSDEKNCTSKTCGENHFTCTSGQCIPQSWHCDAQIDCSDGSDEDSQCDNTEVCDDSQIVCQNGHCVDILMKCNGQNDCEDGTDELDCIDTTTQQSNTTDIGSLCNSTSFLCTSTRTCLPAEIRCNGTSECLKGEDEVDCDICPVQEFKCSSGKCIPKNWLCDLVPDCEDGSDEINCPASKNMTSLADKCNGFPCKDDSACVPLSKLCDGKNDCTDGTDEGGLCGRSCDSSGCDHECIDTPIGSKCDCRAGFTLSGDGRSCLDINECLFHFSCSHYCTNTPGSYKCHCDDSYQLRRDRIRCKAKGKPMEYVYITKHEMRIRSQNLRQVSTIYKHDGDSTTVMGLDLDMVNNVVYWTTEMPGNLMRMSMTGGHTINYIEDLNLPSKVAYDWITNNVFIVEQYKIIKVCSFDVKRCARMYSAKNDISINALALDANSRIMFWSETKSFMFRTSTTVIKKGDMTGKYVSDVVDAIGEVSDIVVDRIHQMIYWADTTNKKIERASYNGSMREQVIETKHTPLDIGLFEDYLYWINSPTNQPGKVYNTFDYVTRCGLYGNVYKKCDNIRLLPLNSQDTISRLRLFHSAIQVSKGKNECLNIKCDHLCVIGNNGPQCVCQDGQFKKTNEKCDNVNEIQVKEKKIDKSFAKEKSYSGWWIFSLLFIIFMTAMTFMYLRYCRSLIKIPIIHYRNSSSENLTEILSTSEYPPSNLMPGKHEYENPLKFG